MFTFRNNVGVTSGRTVRIGVLRQDLRKNASLFAALAHQVGRVSFVLAEILNQLSVRDEIQLNGKGPSSGVRLGGFLKPSGDRCGRHRGALARFMVLAPQCQRFALRGRPVTAP